MACVCAVKDWSIHDHGPWCKLDAMIRKLGSVQALDKELKAGTIEVHELTGAGGSITLARWVRRRSKFAELVKAGWMSIPQMAERLACTPRTVSNRIRDGVIERKRDRRNKSLVRLKQ